MADIERLGRAVKQLQHRHHRAMETQLTRIGTTLAQWDALRAIDRTPGSSARELAAATFQQEQSFGTLASRLEVKGLIERIPDEGGASSTGSRPTARVCSRRVARSRGRCCATPSPRCRRPSRTSC
jgi:hypothetical protein